MSFDVPYPPDYGGAADVFYKIKALKQAGCSIILHCFEYGRGQRQELNQYCEAVHYYPRNGATSFASALPYIVASRRSEALVNNLAAVDAPILFEGIHTTACLSHPALADRKKAIRIHNIEHDYFRQLATSETRFFKQMIYRAEAARLKTYEAGLTDCSTFVALSAADNEHFKRLYPAARHQWIPPFHQYDTIDIQPGTGTYALYHGNLSHPENIEAALFLVTKVASLLHIPLTIAGKDPDKRIAAACVQHNCQLIANPDSATMNDLLRQAQVNVLTTFQTSGVKLKLMAALFGGRHLVVNNHMLHGTGLKADICPLGNTATELAQLINNIKDTPFTEDEIAHRSAALYNYTNAINAQKLIQILC